MLTCANSGERNPERARFCLNCGAPLVVEQRRGVRKVVTVVVCDVTGSTALGERLNPESLGRVMARYFERTREAWRLVDVSPDALGHARHHDNPLVGRQAELQLFDWVFQRAVRTSTCHLLTVLGPAGVGKSRLVAAAVDALDDAATALYGQCPSDAEGSTFWPVAEIVRRAGEIKTAGSPGQAEAKLDELLAGEPDGPQVADRLGRLVGLQPAPVPSEDAVWAVRRFLEVPAARQPLVVVIDDLHWAQPTLLDLIEQVVTLAREAPILLVAVARPELLEQRPGWSGGRLNASTLLLEPLAPDEAATLLEHLAGEASLPAEATGRITRTAEGNPLFLDELLAMLIEEGRLRRLGGRWVADDLTTASTPPTIQALLAARLDRLAGEERALLDRASVMGQAFDRSAVLALSPEPARAEVDARGRELAAAAAERLAAAGRRAMGRGDLPAAINLLERAATLLPAGDRTGLHLLTELGEALVLNVETDRAERVLDEALAAADRAGDRGLAAHATLGKLELRLDSPDRGPDTYRADVQEVLSLLEGIGDEPGQARAWRLLGLDSYLRCQIGRAEDEFQRAVGHAHSAQDELAGLHAMQGRIELARELGEAAAAIAGKLGPSRFAALCSQFLGQVELLAGDPAAAEQWLRWGSGILERMGERGLRSEITANLARALAAQGRDHEAMEVGTLSGELAVRDDLYAQVERRGPMAGVLARRGRLAEAERLAAEAVEMARDSDMLGMQAGALLDLAGVLRSAGRAGEARPLLREALELAEGKGHLVVAGQAGDLLDA